MSRAGGERVGAPLAVQIAAFLLAALVLAQAVNLTVVLLAPPPSPPIYQLSEVAAALQDRAVQPRMGRRLVRTVGAEPMQPALFRVSNVVADWRRRSQRDWAEDDAHGQPGRHAAAVRHQLAGLLNLPDNQVRLWLNDAPLWSVRVRPFHGPPGPGGGPGPQPDPQAPPPPPSAQPAASGQPRAAGPATFDGGGGEPPYGPGRPWLGAGWGPHSHFDPGQRPIVGDFVAAIALPGGEWVTIRPQPAPFPNSWQSRIILWFVGWLAVSALAGWLFARRLTAPIGAFAHAAEKLGRDPRAAPMALRGPAELGQVARAFNDMQVRIKRYVEDRTAMVGAISHDLRTPLTRIRFKVENADAALRAAVLDDVEQMEAMISAVLAFIKDANAPARRERIDLLSLLECEVDAASLTGARAEMLPALPVIVEADPVALKRLFGNLIGNAVKYAGGTSVSLESVGGEAVVRVVDEGPGIAEADLERVFEPFFRAEPSRNLDQGGVGLGLSVARSIARAHGGDLTLEQRQPGLAAVVRLPLPPKGT